MSSAEQRNLNNVEPTEGVQSGRTAGNTAPGGVREGLGNPNARTDDHIDQADLDAEMEELEAKVGGSAPGMLSGEVVGTPAGRWAGKGPRTGES